MFAMRSPVAAMIRDEWRQTRIHIGLMLLLVAATPFYMALMRRLEMRTTEIDGVLFFTLVFLVTWVHGVLLFTHYERENLHLAFPSRFYVMPSSVSTLVGVRMLYGVVVTAIVFGLFDWAVYLGSDDAMLRRPTFSISPALIVPVLLAYFECVFWTLGRKMVMGSIVLALGVLLATVIPASVVLRDDAISTRALFAASTGAIIVFYLIACVGVSIDRAGGLAGLAKRIPIQPISPADVVQEERSARAQFRFELRRRPWVLAFVVGSVVFGCLYPVFLLLVTVGHDAVLRNMAELEKIVESSVNAASLSLLSLYGLLASGLVLWLMDYRDRAYGFARYIFTRPMSTHDLAMARMKVTLVYIAAAYIPVVMFSQSYVFLALLQGRWGLSGLLGILSVNLLIALYFLPAFVVVAWTLLRLGLLVPIAFMVLMPLIALAEELHIDETALLWMGSVVVVAGVMFAFREALRRRVLTRFDLRRLLPIWCACLVALTMNLPLLGKVLWNDNLLGDELAGTVFYLALTLIPLLPFATVPLSLYRARHG